MGVLCALLAASAAPLLASCSGKLGGAGGPFGDGSGSGDSGRNAPAGADGPDGAGEVPGVRGVAWSTRFPRLTHAQWENAVRDVLRLDAPAGLSSSFPPDEGGRFDTGVAAAKVSSTLWSEYQNAAEALAKNIARSPERLAKILPADLPEAAAERGRAFVRAFGRRAFRRPLAEEDVAAYAGLYDLGAELVGGDATAAGVELALRAMLQAPEFLYRVETSTAADGDKIWLGGYEVASRLSFALWNTTPSDELLDAAERGELATAEGVEAWARKLLDDARAAAVLVSFHAQMFHTDNFGGAAKDAAAYPTFTADLDPLLREEARLFFAEVVARAGGGLRDVLTSPSAFVNEKTAEFYGVAGEFGAGFTKVELDPAKRAGILTQVGFLSKHGSLRQSDPIHRGVSVVHDPFCETLAAPNMVPPLPVIKPGETNRERVENHTKACGGTCHNDRINPVGFAFEHFDTVGAWRDVDNGKPVDAASTYELDGASVTFAGAAELMGRLSESPQVHDCYAAGWAEYALGRAPTTWEAETVAALTEASRGGASAKELLLKMTVTDAFRARPATEGTSP